MTEATTSNRRSAALVSASRGFDDGRLSMLAERAGEAGLDPVRVCFEGGHDSNANRQDKPGWFVAPAPIQGWSGRMRNLLVMATASLCGGLLPWMAFVRLVGKHTTCTALASAADKMGGTENPPRVVMAKHWTALPVAIPLAQRFGARLWFDVNEVFEAEHEHKPMWKWLYRPAIRRLAETAMKDADILTITSYAQMQQQPGPEWFYLPNVKQPVQLPESRKTQRPINLVYAGLIEPNRALDQIIHALVAANRTDISLDIIGYGSDNETGRLHSIINRSGLGDRVRLLAPVANSRLVETLADYDLGLCIFSGPSRQYDLSEPNKVYEYLAAGLAIVATGNLAITRLLEGNPSAILLPRQTDNKDGLAEVFAELTPERILPMRESAKETGKRLWTDRSLQEALVTRLLAIA